MKSKIIEQNKKDDITFPQLYKDVAAERLGHNVVVLFTNKKSGVIVFSSDDASSIGYQSDMWIPCSDETSWRRLSTGSQIILTQEDSTD